MTSFYGSFTKKKPSSTVSSAWYSEAELEGFSQTESSSQTRQVGTVQGGGHPSYRTGTGSVAVPSDSSNAARSRVVAGANPGSQPSFYGKGPKLQLQPQRSAARSQAQDQQRNERREPLDDAMPQEESGQQHQPGDGLSLFPKRPPRSAENRALDKDIASCASPSNALAMAVDNESMMDVPNWANLFYALAHFKKHGQNGAGGKHGNHASFVRDPRWARCCGALRPQVKELTARDAANVLWSLATLQECSDPLFLDTADSLSTKASVCDPVGVSKAAWALTTVSQRDRRLELFNHLAVPVVLRAEAFPLGALTMTCYAFAKAAHRDGDVYEAVSIAIREFPDEELRAVDICNIVWAFSTVGYRDDDLFNMLADAHLKKPEVVASFNPQDLTNTMWGLCKVGYVNVPAMNTLAMESIQQRGQFQAIHYSNLIYSFAMLRLRGPDGFISTMADAAIEKIRSFDSGNLAIAVWALAQLQERHQLVDEALQRLQQPEICTTLTSRALSMLFLAFFRLDREEDVDLIFDVTRANCATIGASGFSAVLMSAEHGRNPEREARLQQIMADEADDERMRSAIVNAAVIRQIKRGRLVQASQLLHQLRASGQRCWSAVSDSLLARLAPVNSFDNTEQKNETWERPVKSGIHPIAATRQNEGPHAYTREFMTLQAVLCGAPQGDVDACMAAVEQFAESRSLWLKITAWEKATVVHEVARHARPNLVLEIGAYVGYSAMNLARAVRPHGGRVVSIEVDPLHVTIVRNMVEYAGMTDHVDVWTGYCYDVIPHLVDTYGLHSFGMVFMDQKGTRFHTDLQLMEELGLLADGAVVLADNVLKPGAPQYIWHLARGPWEYLTAVSVREFLLQSEDWMVMAFHDASKEPAEDPPPPLQRIAFESDAFRKRSMFDSVAPSKADWWKFSQQFVEGLDRCGVKPRIVGLHGRDNPALTPADVEGIFRYAGRL